MNLHAGGGPPLSPCIKVCAMDAAREHCLGCRRTLSEIARWWSMNDEEKRSVLAALPSRARPDRGDRAGP
jgi:predicted Fe-S protein YdhL (DUF1289 family)